MEDEKKKYKISRSALLGGILLCLTGIMLYRLFQIQIVEGGEYARNFQLNTQKTRLLKGTRGNIYDRNGSLLASNELSYSITLEDSQEYETNRERQLSLNSIAYKLADKLRQSGQRLECDFKIGISQEGTYEYQANGTALDRFKADIYGKQRISDLTEAEKSITAEEMVHYLSGHSKFALYGEKKKEYSEKERSHYELPGEFTREEVLDIIKIRYALSLNSYQRYLPVTIASGITDETRTYIMEYADELPGVDIIADSVRVYKDAEYAAHILGYTGKIGAEELEEYGAGSAYHSTSVVGKAGMEQYLENVLQGQDGHEEVYVNNVGKVVGMGENMVQPVTGNDVYLTIDIELQKTVYHILEQRLAGILLKNISSVNEYDNQKKAARGNIVIPANDMYFALLDNQVLSLPAEREDGSKEQQVYEAFRVKQAAVLDEVIQSCLEKDVPRRDLPGEMAGYQDFIVKEILSGQWDIIDKEKLRQEEEQYQNWGKDSMVSLREYLSQGVRAGWIDAASLAETGQYVEFEQLYDEFVKRVAAALADNTEFSKLIYRSMLRENSINGRDLCLMLYEQGVLPEEDPDYQKLQSQNLGAYQFMMGKIQSLQITPAQLALDPCSASAVITKPETGEILACVSYPGYDNNRLANGVDEVYYGELLADRSLPLYNRATQQLTAPGSTFKPITAIAGLEEQVITINTKVNCDGVFDELQPVMHCWNRAGHGTIDSVMSGIRHSCNDYFGSVSYWLGMENGSYSDQKSLNKLQYYSELFGLGQPSGIELIESKPQITDEYGIPSAIGQGTHNYATTHLARYISALANQGTLPALTLVGRTEPEGGLEAGGGEAGQIDLPPYVWNNIRTGMQQMAQNNKTLSEINMSIAGKTGTAEETKTRPDHGLFVGYAPAENPEIAIAVRIAHGYTSGNAVLASKDIFNYYFNLEDDAAIITGQAEQASDNAHSD